MMKHIIDQRGQCLAAKMTVADTVRNRNRTKEVLSVFLAELAGGVACIADEEIVRSPVSIINVGLHQRFHLAKPHATLAFLTQIVVVDALGTVIINKSLMPYLQDEVIHRSLLILKAFNTFLCISGIDIEFPISATAHRDIHHAHIGTQSQKSILRLPTDYIVEAVSRFQVHLPKQPIRFLYITFIQIPSLTFIVFLRRT